MGKIGFVGAGNMAEALIKGLITAGIYSPADIFISDIRQDRVKFLSENFGVQTVQENGQLAAKVDTIILSVKPQDMTSALESIKNAVGPDLLVISIAAGVKVAGISRVLGDLAIVRVMPNTPALIGEGAAGLFANDKARPVLEKAMLIFSSVGKAVIVDDEGLIDAVTAVSGSGPAYYFLLTEQIIKAAVRLGLPEDTARELVLQTAKGAALLAIEADEKGQSVTELRRKVTSPGGTTEAALKVLSDGKFAELISAAIEKANDRSQRLSN